MIRGAGMGIAKKGISVTASTVENSLQTQETDENAATEGATQSGILSEKALRYTVKKSRRQAQYHKGRYKEEESVKNSLHFDSVQGTADDIKNRESRKTGTGEKTSVKPFLAKNKRYKKRQGRQHSRRKDNCGGSKDSADFFRKSEEYCNFLF